MRSKTAGTSAAGTSRQMPPGAQQRPEPQAGPERGCLWCQEAGLRRESALGRPFRHLGAIKQKPPPVRGVRQPFVANPAFHDFLRNSKRLGNLDEIQIHGL